MSLAPNIEKFINSNSEFKKGFLHISFRLDVCLRLDESNLFEFKRENSNQAGVIYCEDVIEETDPRLGTGTNVELTSDIRSAFRFTKVHLIIPSSLGAWDDSLIPTIEKEVLYMINKFIDSYKFVTKRFGIENVYSLSSLYELNIISSNEDGKSQGVISIQFPGGLTIRKPFRSQDEINIIKKLTSQHDSLYLVDRFLLDAYKYLSRGYDLQSLINIVTALQLKCKDFYSAIKTEDYELTTQEKMILGDRHNLPGKIKIAFSKILPKRLDGSIIDSAVEAIKERNDIVHDGKRSLTGNIHNYISAVQKVIDLLIL